MMVTKITSPPPEVIVPEFRSTPEQLQNEINYIRAEKITGRMLENGLVSKEEFIRIMQENRLVFQPYLSAIL